MTKTVAIDGTLQRAGSCMMQQVGAGTSKTLVNITFQSQSESRRSLEDSASRS